MPSLISISFSKSKVQEIRHWKKWNGNSSTQKREVAKHIKHFICYTETKKHFEVLKNTLAEFCKRIRPVYFVHFCKQNESNSLYLEI